MSELRKQTEELKRLAAIIQHIDERDAPLAHLVAAAPEMLAVLKKAEEAIASRDIRLVDAIRAIISKAEGRTA